MPEEQTVETGAQAPRTKPDEATMRRRRRLFFTILGVLIAAVAISGFFLARYYGTPPSTPPAPTVTNALPTPGIAPIAQPEGTALAGAIPTAVLQYALTEATQVNTAWGSTEPIAQAGAYEAWHLVYSDGTNQIVVDLSQFADQAAAEAYKATLGAPAEATTGAVTAGGSQTGSYAIWSGPDSGHAVWNNSSVVINATGPGDLLPDFQTAYGL